MKKIYTFLAVVFILSTGKAQVINFTSPGFKARLLAADASNTYAKNLSGVFFKIDANNDGEIEVAEAAAVSYLYAINCNANSLAGIEYFTNLKYLNCGQNQLTALNVNACVLLEHLDCNENQLTTLDLSGCPNLLNLYCFMNQLTSINIDNCTLLKILQCHNNNLLTLNTAVLPNLLLLNAGYNQISYLDLMNCQVLNGITLNNNLMLTTLLIKNGKNNVGMQIYNCSNLGYMCCDESELASFQSFVTAHLWNTELNTYCSFVPGGSFHVFHGTNKFDANANGCDSSDTVFPLFKYAITGLSANTSLFTDTSGNFEIGLPNGSYTFTAVFENPSYFNVSPASVAIQFPENASPFLQDFCITANGIHSDVEVVILPLIAARPGFDANYKLIYKNKGNVPASGAINLTFEDAVLDFLNATPATSSQNTNTLVWNYSGLEPFEKREILFSLNLNTPTDTPPLNAGDQLDFIAVITPVPGDQTPFDNTALFKQNVVNSLDPNDKTCIEGNIVGPEMIGEYVHYVIRFENTGTFAAENIVVRDIMNTAQFDINSLVPLDSSHAFTTRIANTNRVEFIFENINLAFDDANNDGYVAFKIKTKPTLVVGNTFSNNASIYFDYNFPIVTNTATTTIQALANPDFEFGNYFTLAPNPVKEVLSIESSESVEIASISIYNTLGQLVLAITAPTGDIDVSRLEMGSYFIKIISDKGTSASKFIKQ